MEKVKTELKGVLIENSLQNVQGRNKQKEKRVYGQTDMAHSLD